MRTATIILAILACISTIYFLFFSTANRDMGYTSMLLVFAILAYLKLTANNGKNTDSNVR